MTPDEQIADLKRQLIAAGEERDKYHTLLNDMQDANREAKQEIERLKERLKFNAEWIAEAKEEMQHYHSKYQDQEEDWAATKRENERLRAGIEGLDGVIEPLIKFTQAWLNVNPISVASAESVRAIDAGNERLNQLKALLSEEGR